MSEKTGIGWTSATWNATTGCDRVSDSERNPGGCDHCYALDLAARLKVSGNPRYQQDGDPRTSGPGFGLTLHPDKLSEPLHWRKPRRIFVNSMSDVFHDDVPEEFIAEMFGVMAVAGKVHGHQFQILTKRPRRMQYLLAQRSFRDSVASAAYRWAKDRTAAGAIADDIYLEDRFILSPTDKPALWPLPNVWLGVSVEDQKRADLRILLLLETPAAVRFVSCEPLLGPEDLREWMGLISWCIIGGESGPQRRPMDLEWMRSLVRQCQEAGVPTFVKQDAALRPGQQGRIPDDLWALKEFPR